MAPRELEAALRAAIAAALPRAELEAIKDGQDRAVRRLLAGTTSRAEYDAEFAPYLDLRGALELETPAELERALTLVPFPPQIVSSIVAHELAHFREDAREGLGPVFVLQFFRHPDGRLGVYPSVKSQLGSGPPAQLRARLRRSLEAPADPSPRDRSQLRGSD